MRKLLLSLSVFVLIVLLSSFSLSSEKQINISEVNPSMKHSYEASILKDTLSRKYIKDTIMGKTEEVDFYEINISVKLPSGEEAGFFQNSISSKYTSGKGEWEKWTTTTSGAYNHTKVLEKLEEVLRKY